jgi:GMP synthase (glutamine-hydrolysing)
MGKILIVDNGGQYVHRIWRSLREIGNESEIVPPSQILNKLESEKPIGLILSGGPTSVYKDDLGLSKELLNLDIPILGICWGHQFIAHSLGGKVLYGDRGEYGHSTVIVDEEDTILKGMPKEFTAWVSHRDEVEGLPPDFISLAHSQICKIEAMVHKNKPIFGVQFHPEVFHTQDGKTVLKNFVDVCLKR